MALSDKILSVLLGLPEDASQRVAAANDQEAERESLKKVLSFLLDDDLRSQEMRDEGWKIAGLPSGPPGWLKGVIRGGAKASSGLMSERSTRQLLNFLQDTSQDIMHPPSRAYDVGKFSDSIREKSLSAGQEYRRRAGKRYTDAKAKWEKIGGDAEAELEDILGRQLNRPMAIRDKRDLYERVVRAEDDVTRSNRMLELIEESADESNFAMEQAARGRPSENWAIGDRKKRPYRKLWKMSFEDLENDVFNKILPKMDDAQMKEVGRILNDGTISEREAFQKIHAQFSHLDDTIPNPMRQAKARAGIDDSPEAVIKRFQVEVVPKLGEDKYHELQALFDKSGMTAEEIAEFIKLEFGDIFN